MAAEEYSLSAIDQHWELEDDLTIAIYRDDLITLGQQHRATHPLDQPFA